MKLKLEHLAPYLPYGLKCEILNYECDYVGEKYGVIVGYYFYAGEPHYVFQENNAGKDVSLFKPILRPLSDLTKEIEVEGKNFVPNKILLERWDGLYLRTWNIGLGIVLDFMRTIDMLKKPKGYDLIPHWMYQDLIKLHFDVFGLIEKGLAININEI